MRIFYAYKKVLFPYCGITIPVKNKWVVPPLKQGDTVIVYPVKNFRDYIFFKGTGVLAEVLKIEESGKYCLFSFKGLKRVQVHSRRGLWDCEYSTFEQKNIVNPEMAEYLRKKAQELIFLINVDESDKLIHLLNYISDAQQLSDFIANYFILDYDERIKLLNTTDVISRSNAIIGLLNELINNVKKKRETEIHEKENIPG